MVASKSFGNSLLNVVLYDKPEIRKNDPSNGPR